MHVSDTTWTAPPPALDADLQSCAGIVDAATAAAVEVVLWGDDDAVLACSAAALIAVHPAETRLAA